MLIIGLTGGIGSGKSAVANFFKEQNIAVASADEINHQLLQKGSPAHQKIYEHFGPSCLAENQEIDRQKLRNIIFKQPQEKTWLEKLLHPIITEELKKFVLQSTGPYCVLEIPLLLEANLNITVDRILVVDIPEEQQISRAQQRSNLSTEELKTIISLQMPRSERLQHADDILNNSGTLAQLKEKVLKLHEFYLALAKNKT